MKMAINANSGNKHPAENTDRKPEEVKIKKWPYAIVIIAFLLLAVLIFGIFAVVKTLNGRSGDSSSGKDVISYFEQNWDYFSEPSYDEKSGVVTLKKTYDYSFEKFENSAGAFDNTVEGHLETIGDMMEYCRKAVNIDLTDVLIIGISSDGKQVYRVGREGVQYVCWKTNH